MSLSVAVKDPRVLHDFGDVITVLRLCVHRVWFKNAESIQSKSETRPTPGDQGLKTEDWPDLERIKA